MEAPMLEDYGMETSSDQRIVQVVRQASEEARGHAAIVGVPYGSDGSKIARTGIPSIVLGPGSIDQAHAAEEYVELDQVALAAEIYARTILEF
jgi:acetylornithine deacetylase